MVPIRSKGLWTEALSDLATSEWAAESSAESSAASGKRELIPRRMHDSYCEILLPFASSPELLENYTNATGGIRTGLLMEHLDSLAGSIAYKHMLGPAVTALPKDAGFYMVTASVDRWDFFPLIDEAQANWLLA